MSPKTPVKFNWLTAIIIFILGILIAANAFLFYSLYKSDQNTVKLKNEIDKLKADDIAIAQAINNLTSQLEMAGLIKINQEEKQ